MKTIPHTSIRLVVFGGTGHCGRAVAEAAANWNRHQIKLGNDRGDDDKNVQFQVTVFCRDEIHAKKILKDRLVGSSMAAGAGAQNPPHHQGKDDAAVDVAEDHSSVVKYMVGDIFNPSHVAAAIEQTDVAINCLSSYTSPHTQMSILIQNILQATTNSSSSTSPSLRWLIHYGYPRGHCYYNTATNQTIMGTRLEHGITSMVRILSCTKYGPAIRDHDRVLDLLLEQEKKKNLPSQNNPNNIQQSLDYCLFAAPNMIERRATSATAASPTKEKSYHGGPGSVERAISGSRVWHSVSTRDAADMILSHVADAVQQQNSTKKTLLPPLVCLSYR